MLTCESDKHVGLLEMDLVCASVWCAHKSPTMLRAAKLLPTVFVVDCKTTLHSRAVAAKKYAPLPTPIKNNRFASAIVSGRARTFANNTHRQRHIYG